MAASFTLMGFGGDSDSSAAVEREQGGTVMGTVRLDVPPPEPPPMLSPYSRRRYSRPPRFIAGGVTDVVVFLQAQSPPGSAPDSTVKIAQRNRTIVPHVTTIQTGTRVDFPNEDVVIHNLFSLSRGNRFNLGRYPPKESQSHVFENPGIVRLFCDIHAEMAGVILVLDTPYFTRPNPDGSYRISGVPPGRYSVVAWHENAAPDSTVVVVPDSGVVTVDFHILP
ncbi:MAG: carboxypeptidase regulatory-like domain-containing protein [Gemmatimonadetes bacterium]|nr:carboxypeptidase regulatory-like domain-containing protein [Gemmatimonadota bacterium]